MKTRMQKKKLFSESNESRIIGVSPNSLHVCRVTLHLSSAFQKLLNLLRECSFHTSTGKSRLQYRTTYVVTRNVDPLTERRKKRCLF